MSTDDKLFERVHDLFMQVVELSPEHRENILATQCKSDPRLLAEVHALLQADAEMPTGRFTRAIDGAKSGAPLRPHEALSGSILGSYKLTTVLGRGGAGIVYLGERIDRQYSQHVAIKVVEAPSDKSLNDRHIAELQILAKLNHPNIARLIDAGESPDHFPYIVMEYVHGESLDKYCDSRELSVDARLRLFVQICDAVRYAHRHLIVHRDLKPSNILVTQDGQVKLLDFGIAKLLSTGISTPALTRLNDRALTPEYASPEQLLGRIVSTSSDVYSLGVVLYELLAGMPPYALKSISQLDLERAVCHTDPDKPSLAVMRAAAEGGSIAYRTVERAAKLRRTTPTRLRAALVGDLDAIVMHAMRKEPEKRYASVEMFVGDITRHIQTQPIVARQGMWTYYVTRFVRRNWIPVSASAVVMVALLVSTVVTTVMYNQARVDKDHADQVSSLMTAIFNKADPYGAQGKEVTALNLLDAASERFDDVAQDDEVKGRMLKQFGEAYLNLGQYDKAVEQLTKAITIAERIHPDSALDLANLYTSLGSTERGQGHFDKALEIYKRAESILGSKNLKDSAEYATLLRSMGRLYHTRGELPTAEQKYLASIAVSDKLRPDSPEVGQTLVELASVYNWMNDLKAAERTGRRALDIFRTNLPDTHPDRIFVQLQLGDILSQLGRVDEAANLIEVSVTSQRTIYHNAGPQLAQSIHLLANVKKMQGRNREAEQLFRESVDYARRALGPEHYSTAYYQTSLGKFFLEQKRFVEAQEQLNASLLIFSKTLPSTHQYVAAARHYLGETLIGLGKFDGAIDVLKSARLSWIEGKAARWRVARTESALGLALTKKGVTGEGFAYLQSAYDTLLQDRGENDEATRLALARLESFRRTRTVQQAKLVRE